MKRFLPFLLTSLFLTAAAQDKNQFYALDAKMNQTVLDSSKYILWIHETENSRWQWDYYYTWGPLVKSTRYADHDGTVPDGRFCIYDIQGNLDSTGLFDHGKKNGSFYKLKTFSPDSIVMFRQTDWILDSLVKSIDFLSEDSKNKQIDTAGEKESEFPGGVAQWQLYLSKNQNYPERAVTKEIQGQVRIYFMVDREGNIIDPYIQKSVEYSLDQEALRIIKNSGRWDPAQKNGTAINSYKVQPFNYRLESH